jgi:hypothetical protein
VCAKSSEEVGEKRTIRRHVDFDTPDLEDLEQRRREKDGGLEAPS